MRLSDGFTPCNPKDFEHHTDKSDKGKVGLFPSFSESIYRLDLPKTEFHPNVPLARNRLQANANAPAQVTSKRAIAGQRQRTRYPHRSPRNGRLLPKPPPPYYHARFFLSGDVTELEFVTSMYNGKCGTRSNKIRRDLS